MLALQTKKATPLLTSWHLTRPLSAIAAAIRQATRMNALLVELRRSMEELQLGLDGALNMSDKMEALARGIATNTVGDWVKHCRQHACSNAQPLDGEITTTFKAPATICNAAH